MTQEDRRVLLRQMRTPAITLCVLMALLGVNVLLGATLPWRNVWIAELAVAAVMVAIVLLVSMEVLREPPLVRLFSVLGFFWVGIMFGMTLTDYLGR
jgi:cytochrome c oxidase subunit 4